MCSYKKILLPLQLPKLSKSIWIWVHTFVTIVWSISLLTSFLAYPSWFVTWWFIQTVNATVVGTVITKVSVITFFVKKSFVLNYIRCLLFGHTFLFWFHVCFLQRKKMLKVVKKGQSKCINSFNKIIKYVEGQNNFSLCNTILIIVKIIVFEIKF